MVNGKIGGAVIGCGGMGSWHAEKMSKYMNDRMELVGIYDINPAKNKEAGEKGWHAFSSPEELLDDDRIDFVVVATPNDFHHDIVIAALEAGKNVMSVDVPVFDFTTTAEDASNIYPYGYANTSGELDSAIASLADVFPLMLELAAKEKEAQMLAAELERTRRRVNALEYVKIPQLEMTIKYIRMRLDENERGNQTRLMKVKDMVLKEAIQEKHDADEEAYNAAVKHAIKHSRKPINIM